MTRVYMYSVFERVWHWAQALAIIVLLGTGLEIHAPDSFPFMAYQDATWIHIVLGFFLIADAFMGLFYHLATGKIRQYLPEPTGFIPMAVKQATYYLRGIFRGEPHPLEKSPENKLNPLQKITYLGILNVLLPLQVVTGILIWGAKEFPTLLEAVGGLGILVPIHALVAWLFGAFIVVHVYLTTTGATPLASIKAMITGWEEMEDHDGGQTGEEATKGVEAS